MTSERITYLFEQYQTKRATQQEIEELFVWVRHPDHEAEVLSYFVGLIRTGPVMELNAQEWEPVLSNILTVLKEEETLEEEVPRRAGFFRWWMAAAAVLLLTLAGWWLFERETPVAEAPVATQQIKNDIKPPVDKAVLTLADGRTVVLDSSLSGSLATEGSVEVRRLANGEIVYGAPATAAEVVYHTITNPKGSQVVSLVLADGSRVWLDAASSIRYPTAFIGKERRVEISGQAYFEIAHNTAQPFTVKVPPLTAGNREGMEVQVLGTRFNVNSHMDEATIRTTLLEGRVRISTPKGRNTHILRPGQQAVFIDDARFTVETTPDLEQVMAWKEGRFQFSGTGLREVMRQLERWYDVEVVYEGGGPSPAARDDKGLARDDKGLTFSGAVSRMSNMSEVLRMLELTGAVGFEVSGRRVVVREGKR